MAPPAVLGDAQVLQVWHAQAPVRSGPSAPVRLEAGGVADAPVAERALDRRRELQVAHVAQLRMPLPRGQVDAPVALQARNTHREGRLSVGIHW